VCQLQLTNCEIDGVHEEEEEDDDDDDLGFGEV
jgi:hypothetical protein